MATLYHLLLMKNHIVTQVVKAKLVVGSIGNIRLVRTHFLVTLLIWNNKPCGKTEIAVHSAHFLAVTAGKVIVNGYDMNAVACEGV